MGLIELTLKKKGSTEGDPIHVNTDHIVYYRKYKTVPGEDHSAVFTANKMLVVKESIKNINKLIKSVESCLQTI
jgi:hypothetical protein